MLTDKQIEQRKKLITATDIPTLLGMNPWSTPLKLYEYKKGISQPSVAGPAAMWGHIKEPIIVKLYKDLHESNIKTYESKTIQIPNCLNGGMGIGATPDRICVRDMFAWLLECKSTGQGHDWSKSAPERHRYQVQWQMHVLHEKLKTKKKLTGWWKYLPKNAEDMFTDIACEHGNGMVVYREHYDSGMVAEALEASMYFAGQMESEVRPHPVKGDADYLTSKTFDGEGVLPEDINESAKVFLDIKNANKQNSDLERKYKAFLLSALEENGGISIGKTSSYEIALKQNKSSTVTDWESVALHLKQYAEDHFKRIVKECTKEKPGAKVFRVKEVG